MGRFRPGRRPRPKLLEVTAALASVISARELTEHVQTHLVTKSKESLFSQRTLREARKAIAEAAGLETPCIHDCPPGQPFYTALLEALLTAAADIDAQFPRQACEGSPLGVDEPIEPAEGIRAYRDAFLDDDDDWPPNRPHSEMNYKTAEEFLSGIRATYVAEV